MSYQNLVFYSNRLRHVLAMFELSAMHTLFTSVEKYNSIFSGNLGIYIRQKFRGCL